MKHLYKILYRFSYLFWMAGILLPSLYLMGLLQIKESVQAIRKDPWMKILFLFIVFQIVVLVSATRFDFVTHERLLGAAHNVVSFGFIIIGFAAMASEKWRKVISHYSKEVFMALSIIVIASAVISLWTQKLLIYPGLLSFLGENKFTMVQYNRIENIVIHYFPRSRVMGIYSGTTALLLLASFLLYVHSYWDTLQNRKGKIAQALFIVSTFFTGARVFILISFALFALWYVRDGRVFKKIFKRLPQLMLVLIPVIIGALFLRSGSNNTRLFLYSHSISFWMEHSFWFGVGVKPFSVEFSNIIPYPLGSHSTLIGYFLKLGIFGGLWALGMYVFFIKNYFQQLRYWFKEQKNFSHQQFFLLTGVVSFVLATWIEDIDSFEIVALYFGMILYLAKQVMVHKPQANLLEIIASKSTFSTDVEGALLTTFLNPYSYLKAREKTALFAKMDRIHVDGISLVKMLRWFGVKTDRKSFDMTSVAPQLFAACQQNQRSIYFIGAQQSEVEKAVAIIQSKYSNLKISGYRNGYIEDEFAQAVSTIVQLNPDYVVVGMGVMLQESFLLALREAGFKGGGYTCGGFLHQTAVGLDYYPHWADRYHLRWLYRMMDEPKLIPRYLLQYPLSAHHLFQDWLMREKN